MSSYSDVRNPVHRGPGPLTSATAQPIIRVTIAFVVLYYFFIHFQSWTKFFIHDKLQKAAAVNDKIKQLTFADIKYGTSSVKHKLTLTGDRTVGNMLEQALPFLVSLWLHGTYIDVGSAAKLGWQWLIFRCIYPVVFYAGPPILFVSTLPGYWIIFCLLWPVGVKVFLAGLLDMSSEAAGSP
jgi:hypothetical protein